MSKGQKDIQALVAKKRRERARLSEQIRQIDIELEALEAAWQQCDVLAAIRAAAKES